MLLNYSDNIINQRAEITEQTSYYYQEVTPDSHGKITAKLPISVSMKPSEREGGQAPDSHGKITAQTFLPAR